jgi:hypothetical protein
MMRTFTQDIRGIPFFLLQEYLQEMGGKPGEGGLIHATGWTVRMTRLEPFRLGSLEIGQTRLEVQIEEQLADDFLDSLSKKTLRAGG